VVALAVEPLTQPVRLPDRPPGSPTEGETGQTPKERVIPGVVESAYKHQRQDVARLGKQLDLPFTTWSVTKLAGYSASTRGSRSARVGLPDPARGWDPVAGQEDLEGQP
jgi:hypothetical protein